MEPKVNYLYVGIFVVLLGAVAVVVVLWLGKADYRVVYDRYYAYMEESVAGLSVNSAVKYRGVDVGSVVEIALNPENPEQVRITMEIKRGTPIKQDTVAVLHVQGLTGFAIIDLSGGSRNSAPLRARAGETYPVIQTGQSLFTRLEETGSQLITNLNSVAESFRSVIDEKNRAALNQILQDVGNLTRMLSAQREGIARGVGAAAESAENLSKLSKRLNEQMPGLLDRIEKTAASMQKASDDVSAAGKSVSSMVNGARPDIEQFGRQTLGETAQLAAELRQLTATLQQLAQQLEAEPQSLIFGRSPGRRGPGE